MCLPNGSQQSSPLVTLLLLLSGLWPNPGPPATHAASAGAVSRGVSGRASVVAVRSGSTSDAVAKPEYRSITEIHGDVSLAPQWSLRRRRQRSRPQLLQLQHQPHNLLQQYRLRIARRKLQATFYNGMPMATKITRTNSSNSSPTARYWWHAFRRTSCLTSPQTSTIKNYSVITNDHPGGHGG